MIINFQNLSKSFQQGAELISVLEKLNLQVQRGEKVAIIGESGSGKTTLLSLIAGLDLPTSGKAQIFDRDIYDLTQDEIVDLRGRKMGIVFQNYYLIPYLTAYENIQLPLDICRLPVDSGRIQTLLERVKLAHRSNHFFHQLSGGEAQRVAIARALIHEPDLILADEPSGNLDEETGNQVMDMLFNLVEQQKSTLVLVTHNKELAKRCDRVLSLQQGKLIEA